jgi:hypothetical protein
MKYQLSVAATTAINNSAANNSTQVTGNKTNWQPEAPKNYELRTMN